MGIMECSKEDGSSDVINYTTKQISSQSYTITSILGCTFHSVKTTVSQLESCVEFQFETVAQSSTFMGFANNSHCRDLHVLSLAISIRQRRLLLSLFHKLLFLIRHILFQGNKSGLFCLCAIFHFRNTSFSLFSQHLPFLFIR